MFGAEFVVAFLVVVLVLGDAGVVGDELVEGVVCGVDLGGQLVCLDV